MQAAVSSDNSSSLQKQPLPDEPVVTIQPGKSWRAVNPVEFWDYRELLYFLIWRDIKVRYKQTALGVLWVIIQPVTTMLIFTLLFGRFAGLDVHTGGIPYPLFAFAGLLPWMYFANALTTSGNSLVTSSNLITKIYFPRMIVPAAAVAAGLVDFLIGSIVLAVLMFIYGMGVTQWLFLLPLLVLLLTLLVFSVGLLLSGLNVKYRDIRYALPFLIQIWMFVSPVIYPSTILPKKWLWVLALNPMTGIIEGFRAALFGPTESVWEPLAVSVIVTIALLVCAAFIFRRIERDFADVI